MVVAAASAAAEGKLGKLRSAIIFFFLSPGHREAALSFFFPFLSSFPPSSSCSPRSEPENKNGLFFCFFGERYGGERRERWVRLVKREKVSV